MSTMQEKLKKMNPRQLEAVLHTEGPLLILAGAGSGKTTVLINRIAYIIDQSLAKPWQILAITFTNKAAGELKERLTAMLGDTGGDVWAATFHSTCARILRRDGDRIGYSSHFTVYDTDDSKRLVKDCQKALNIDDKMISHKSILSEISHAKDSMLSPADYQAAAGSDFRLTKSEQFMSCIKSACGKRTLWISTICWGILWSCSVNVPMFWNTIKTGSATSWWTSIRIPTKYSMNLSAFLPGKAKTSAWWATTTKASISFEARPSRIS